MSITENTGDFSFGIDTKSSFGVDEDGVFELSGSKDTMYFSVGSAREEHRQFAVQIFVDYVQMPIVIENVTYDTFFIDAKDNFSKEYAFQFAEDIDTTKNHKIFAILTADSDMLMAKQEDTQGLVCLQPLRFALMGF